jgi:hypothetical protein
MTSGKIRVAVVGAGRWAQVAHIPGWLRDPRAEVVALDGGRPGQGDFGQGALVQETINAFEASFRSRAWVSFPLADPAEQAAGA